MFYVSPKVTTKKISIEDTKENKKESKHVTTRINEAKKKRAMKEKRVKERK